MSVAWLLKVLLTVVCAVVVFALVVFLIPLLAGIMSLHLPELLVNSFALLCALLAAWSVWNRNPPAIP